jgi:ComF family protein
MKYNRRRTLGGVLAEKMRECIEKHIAVPDIDIITPVPLHWKKINDRGFNQAQIFAEHLAQTLHIGCSAGNLIRVRKTRSQFSLKKEQRPDNVHGAFSCRNSAEFQGKKILLIDDIFTTGATANECARILKNAGAARVIALSLARS